jgi:hypothetical protein
MRSVLYFAIGVFLAFCLFWPVNSFAGSENSSFTTRGDTLQSYASFNVDGGWYSYTGTVGTGGGWLCSKMGTYVALSNNQVRKYYSSTQAGYDYCAANPTFNTSSAWGRTLEYTFLSTNGCNPLPTEPATCNDDKLTDGETGIDCGGPCFSACTSFCPPPSSSWNVGGESGCIWVTGTDAYGNCNTVNGFIKTAVTECPPSGCSGSVQVGQDVCAKPVSAVMAKSSDQVSMLSGGGWVQFHGETTTTTNGDGQTVDNGDGTSTRTTTSTTTGGGSTTTTTTTTTINNATGAVLSQGTTTTEIGPPEANEGNYEAGGGGLKFADTTFDTSIELPAVRGEGSGGLLGLVQAGVQSLPIYSALDTFTMTTSSPVCSIDIDTSDTILAGVPIKFSLCEWESILMGVGAIFLILTQAFAVLVVIRGWR